MAYAATAEIFGEWIDVIGVETLREIWGRVSQRTLYRWAADEHSAADHTENPVSRLCRTVNILKVTGHEAAADRAMSVIADETGYAVMPICHAPESDDELGMILIRLNAAVGKLCTAYQDLAGSGLLEDETKTRETIRAIIREVRRIESAYDEKKR